MDGLERVTHGGRETRLLLVTIAVSIGVLLLLSRFRFPEHAAEAPATPAAAPLERLAARAAYDELAYTMTDLERRLTGAVLVLPVQPQRESGGYVVAPRLTPDRAVTLLRAGEALPGDTASTTRVVATDATRDVAVVAVPTEVYAVVTARSGAPRPGPRYVVAVEGSADGLTLRPVYVGRTSLLQDERTSSPMLSLSGLQYPVARGAAIFSLDGTFIGLVAGGTTTASVIPGDFLKQTAESAVPAAERSGGTLGVGVEGLNEALTRATSAPSGVIVNDVFAQGASASVLLPGDVVQAINGTPVLSVAEFRQVEQALVPGQPVVLSVLRRRAPTQVTVRATDAASRPTSPAVDAPGFLLRDIEGRGIEVMAVDANSPAAHAGLQRGDIMVAIDGRPATETAALNREYSTATAGTAWIVTVQRGLQRRTLALEKR